MKNPKRMVRSHDGHHMRIYGLSKDVCGAHHRYCMPLHTIMGFNAEQNWFQYDWTTHKIGGCGCICRLQLMHYGGAMTGAGPVLHHATPFFPAHLERIWLAKKSFNWVALKIGVGGRLLHLCKEHGCTTLWRSTNSNFPSSGLFAHQFQEVSRWRMIDTSKLRRRGKYYWFLAKSQWAGV